MAANFAWGIDVGNRALKAIKLVRDGDGVRIEDFEVIEHETVLSQAGDNREAMIQAALSNLVARHAFKGGVCGVGVSGQSSFARFIKLPPVEPKKIPEIVRFEAIQQIPFPLDDVEWSYQLFQSETSPDVEVGIFAMRKELVNQHISYFIDQELNVQVVQMNPLAVYNAMAYDGKIKGTTMIVDLGAENTDLIIADEDTIWMRSIPIGGNNFTEALVKSFKLNFQKAEELKRNAASSKYARQIFQAMRPIFADLVAEVQRSIGFYASVHRDSRIKKIIALGGTFKLPGLQKYLQQNLQLDVERLDRLAAAPPTDGKLAAAFNENALAMVGAYGLALQAMGEGKISSSLLPARIRREKAWQEKTKWFAAAAALFVLGTAIPYGSWFIHKMQYDNESAARATIASVQATAAALDTEWQQIQDSGTNDRQRIMNIRSLSEYRDLWPQLLADINSVIPKGDPATLKQVPRKEREVVNVENIITRYEPNIGVAVADPDFKRFAGVAGSGAMTGSFAAPTPAAGMGMDPGMMEDPAMMMEDPAMMGMGMDMGMSPQPVAPVPGAAPVAGGASTGHGFIITLTGTTPHGDPASLLTDTVIKDLGELSLAKLPKGKKYYIAKAEIVTTAPLRANQARITELQRVFQAAEEARGLAAQQQQQQQPYQRGLYDPAMQPEIDMDPAMNGIGGVGQPALGPNGQPLEDPRPFRDRQFPSEDVRDDSEFSIVFAVVLDPNEAPPADPNAAPLDPAADPTAAAVP
ncbi:MAG TPA: type IV pilus assembly protein PilM [Tepidisphaeraceae bacterium]|nr:type IV pilus assembly protein PilM [Tepidisphaeraceae bacterium]